MNSPANLKYTKEHEWVKLDGDTALIGITDYAQSELGDIVFVELPSIGEETVREQPCGSIEAVKAVSDLFAPVSGEVTEINGELESNPQTVNRDCYGSGWMLKVRISDAGEMESLLTADQYQELISGS
jgi:glycine cleavage system H protein